MKTCPVCMLDLEDTFLFCPDDGSSLGTLEGKDFAHNSTENEPRSFCESGEEISGAVVLYCPTCAAEYPLTFSLCPVHGVQLAKHKIPRLSNREQDHPTPVGPNKEEAAAPQLKPHEPKLPSQLTSLHLERPRIERPQRITAGSPDESVREIGERHAGFDGPQQASVDPSHNSAAEFNCPETLHDVQEQGFERRGFRVAAIATVIALGLFGLMALYAVVSNLSRRTSPVARVASQAEASQPLPFIATPQEAQDYKDQQPAPAASASPDRQAERPVERRRDENTSSSSSERNARRAAVAQSVPKTPAPTPAPPRMTKVSNPPAPELPRGSSAGFDARLVRVRGRKSPSGFRYDLTFNMQEQAGRAAHWQRLLITTRSASGKSHSESIPFTHRLGATGALTFTISVELAGRSEAEWQGRVVCTTLGWDNKGAPLQTSFGANVTPW